MKIFCIGANLESERCLQEFVKSGCKIHTLITLPKGANNLISDYVDLHNFCLDNGISVIETTDVNSKETISAIHKESPDYLFTLGWSQLFKTEFISLFSEFIVGTHPTKLPYGRGRAPLPWTILEGLTESAVSFFKIDTGVDTGKLILQKEFKIPDDCYVGELYDIVSQILASGFIDIYMKIKQGETFSFREQGIEGLSYRAKRTPADGIIDFNQSASKIKTLVRAVSRPYPGAYTYYKDRKIIFWKVAKDTEGIYSGTIAQILKRSNDGILVQCGEGTIWLNDATDNNGKTFDKKFFKIGDKLGYNIQDEIFKIKNNL